MSEGHQLEGEGQESGSPGSVRGVNGPAKPVLEALIALPSDERRKVFRALGRSVPGGSAPQARIAIEAMTEMSVWQGPLPPADQLLKYNEAVSGGAERILAMAEKQQAHRINIEGKTVTGQLKQSGLGQIFGLVIGLASIAAGTYLGVLGKDVLGGTVITVGVGSLAVTYVIGKRKEQTSRARKQ